MKIMKKGSSHTYETKCKMSEYWETRYPPENKISMRHDRYKRYYDKNGGLVSTKKRDHVRILRSKVVEFLGGKCVKCGYSDKRALQIDHVNGDGYLERKKKSNVVRYLADVIVDIYIHGGRYQLLCANCNIIKKFENNEM